jgi:cobalamin biosynthesis Mg chelatase CobN
MYSSYETANKLNKVQTLLGNQAVFEEMRKFAGEAGVGIDKLIEQGGALAKAYQPKRALTLFKSLQDLTAKGILNEQSTGEAIDTLKELSAKSRVGQADFEKMVKVFGKGFNMESLSKAAGKTIPELQKALKDGTLDVDALLKTMVRLSGLPAGDLAKKVALEKIDAQLTNIKTTVSNIGMNVLGAVFGDEKQIAAGLANINKILQEAFSVDRIRNVIETFKQLKDFAIVLGSTIAVALVPALISAGMAATTASIAFLAPLAPFLAVGAAIGLLIVYWDDVSKAMERFGATAYDIGQGIKSWIVDKFGAVVGYLSALPSKLYEYGTNIIQGLWDGIKNKFKSMLEWFKDLTNKLPESIKKILGIASPSKVFKKLGMNTMEGFRFGLQHQSKAALAQQVEFNKKLIAVQTELSRNTRTLFAPWGINTPSDLNKLWSPDLIAKASGAQKQEEEEAKQVINAAASSPSPFMKTLAPQPSNSKPQIVNNVPINIKIDVKPGGVVDKNVESMLTEALQNSIIDILSKQIIS